MRIFLLAVLSLSLSGLFAQSQRCSFQTPQQADNWLFIENVGLKFTDEGVQTIHLSSPNLEAGKGTAAISDESGKLLLYTDGMKVWNGTHVHINPGSNLRGNVGATQSSLIVPKPGSTKNYYIFTADIVLPPVLGPMQGLNYSMVDITANGNQGAVSSERDIQLVPEVAEMITGIKHGNGTDYWIVTHGLNDNSFHAFIVDSSGVNQTAVVSYAGGALDGDYENREYMGAMKISPTGDKIAYASFGRGVVEVFPFDNNTGRVGDPMVNIPVSLTDPDFYGPYYVEFSPDGTKLYYTVTYRQNPPDNHLYQYDIVNGGQSVLLNEAPLNADVSALQLARDGKIYVGRYQKNMLGVVENPNRPGLSCNYNQDGVNLGAKRALSGMTNFVQSYFDIPAFDYDTKCLGDETMFTVLNKSNIDEVSWNYGDPHNPAQGEGFNPTHIYSEPGEYEVTLTETYKDEVYTTTIPVIIHSLPPIPLADKGESMYLFPGSRVTLDAGEGMFAYQWQDGSTDQFFEVDQGGEIEATVEDINCCYNTGSLEVILLAITLPNAFTPNGDDLNQEFYAFGPSEGIENFNLKIYNSWGQMVWEANDFSQKWDGTVNGQSASTGLYTWLLGFDVIGDLTGIGRVKYKGTVTLLR